jgi:hypothetical protein
VRWVRPDATAIPPREHRLVCRIETDTTPVQVRGEPLAPIWWRGRQWAVTTYGIEALDGTYAVDACDLLRGISERDEWVCEHVARNTWVNVEDLATAWIVAIALHGGKADPAQLRKAIEATAGKREIAATEITPRRASARKRAK